jgi:hypothetical protein
MKETRQANKSQRTIFMYAGFLLLAFISTQSTHAQLSFMDDLKENSTILSASSGVTNETDSYWPSHSYPYSNDSPTTIKTHFSLVKIANKNQYFTPIFGYESTQDHTDNTQRFYEEKTRNFTLGIIGNTADYLFEFTYSDSEYSNRNQYSLSFPFVLLSNLNSEFGVGYSDVRLKSSAFSARAPANADSLSIFGNIKYEATDRLDISAGLAVSQYRDTYYIDNARLQEILLQADAIDYDYALNADDEVAREAIESSLGSFGEVLDLEDNGTLIFPNTTALKIKPALSFNTRLNYAVSSNINLGISAYYKRLSVTDSDLYRSSKERSSLSSTSSFLTASYKFL